MFVRGGPFAFEFTRAGVELALAFKFRFVARLAFAFWVRFVKRFELPLVLSFPLRFAGLRFCLLSFSFVLAAELFSCLFELLEFAFVFVFG